MQLELRIIGLYSLLEECYTKELHWYCQRFSNNKHQGNFTDVELLTCYFFAIIEEKKYQVKQIYEYIVKYWSDWFPALPSYQCFNKRINRMGESLPILLGVLSSQLQPITGLVSKDLLLDSVPVILCKGKRQGKVASEMAAKTYSSSKGIYYYGVKLHWMGMSQANRGPGNIFRGKVHFHFKLEITVIFLLLFLPGLF